MREILFRGKREDNGEWVYGYYVKLPDAAGSVCFMHVPAGNPDERNTAHYVALETVGQYTGLTDKNGMKIFEGDIVSYGRTLHKVVFCNINGCAFFGIAMPERGEIWRFDASTPCDRMKVIGNIHDNPELIGGEENAEIH
ncbi:MAG: hypothetical protein IKN17_06070 [Ruminococcus sp.]|nr:hypothetical protein [Ruminococcus sp.]